MILGTKLLLASGAVSAITLAVGLTAWMDVSGLGQTVRKLVTIDGQKLYLAGDIDTTMSNIIGEERGILAQAFTNDRAPISKYNRQFEQNLARLKKDLDEFFPMLETVEGKRMLENLQSARDVVSQNHQEFLKFAANGDAAAALKVYNEKINPFANGVSETTEHLLKHQNDLMAEVAKGAEGYVARNSWITTSLLGFALLFCGLVIFTIWQAIASLRKYVFELSEGAEQVASAASQVSASSQTLAQGASQQAASLEETSASTEEIGSMARRNSENSTSTADLVTRSTRGFEESAQLLQQTVTAMGEISTSSEKIFKIIKVIDEIAFQTNILALNAAVEAARAGEAGMGFAVVADEVRNLAQRCAQAAKDTETLIEDCITKSREGKVKVDRTSEAIQAISGQSTQMRTLVDEVKLGSEEQARGIEQIAKAVVQMEQVTQSTAASAEECAAAAEQMSSQSASVRDVISQLNAMLGSSTVSDSFRPRQTNLTRSAAMKSPNRIAFSSNISALKTATSHKLAKKSGSSRPASVDFAEFPLEEAFKEF